MKLSEATYFPDAKELTRHGFVSHMEDFIGKLIGDNPLAADVDDYLKGFDIDAPKALKMLTTPEIEGNPDSAVIIRTERIKNGGVDEFGKPMKDEFQIMYKVPKRNPELGIKGIDEKLRNLYIKTFENHEIKGTVLNEDGEGGAMEGMGGATNADNSNASAPIVPLGRKTTGDVEEDEKEQFPVMRRSVYAPKTQNEGKKKMKAPIGKKMVFITEEQMRQLSEILKEEAVLDSSIGDFGYDDPGFRTKGKDFFKDANDREDILSRRNPDNKAAGHESLEEGDSGMHIKKKNKGKFTATKKRTGKSTEELTHSKNPLTRKRANFARMAKRGWKPLKNKD